MGRAIRLRFWTETVFGSIAGVLFLVTLFWKNWIEIVFGLDPDNNNGSLEWLILAVLLVVSAALLVLARFDWQTIRTTVSKEPSL